MAASLAPKPDHGAAPKGPVGRLAQPGSGRASTKRGRTLSAWDGLPLFIREWGCPWRQDPLPLLCLPGLVRTGEDFSPLGTRFGEQRRVLAPDYAGRGQSGRSHDLHRYGAEACLADVLDLAAALHLERVVAIGTSFGGILAMAMAAARPGLLAGVVLNDVGPEIGPLGHQSICRFLAETPDLGDLDACALHLQRLLPDLGIETAEGWRELARLTYAPSAGGRWLPLWDTRIARLLDAPIPDLWPLFGALAYLPVLLVRGTRSKILLPETVARMQCSHPRLTVLEVPGVGHAPTLSEPTVLAALDEFVADLG
jgi:pimeloyl-ACP methyl ester carboxylesterase